MQITQVDASYSHAVPSSSADNDTAAAPPCVCLTTGSNITVVARSPAGDRGESQPAPPPPPPPPPPTPPTPSVGIFTLVQAFKDGDGIVAAEVPVIEAVVVAAGALRSKVAVATKTTRQQASSKLLKTLPLHCRKKSSALACRRTDRGESKVWSCETHRKKRARSARGSLRAKVWLKISICEVL